jgi:hypothetical protein
MTHLSDLEAFRKLKQKIVYMHRDDAVDDLKHFFETHDILNKNISLWNIPSIFCYMAEMPSVEDYQDFSSNNDDYFSTDTIENDKKILSLYESILLVIFNGKSFDEIRDIVFSLKDKQGQGIFAYIENKTLCQALLNTSGLFTNNTEAKKYKDFIIDSLQDHSQQGLIVQKYSIQDFYSKHLGTSFDVNDMFPIVDVFVDGLLDKKSKTTHILLGHPKNESLTVKMLQTFLAKDIADKKINPIDYVLKSYPPYDNDNFYKDNTLSDIYPLLKKRKINSFLLPIFLRNWNSDLVFALQTYKETHTGNSVNPMALSVLQNEMMDHHKFLWNPLIESLDLKKTCSYSSTDLNHLKFIRQFLSISRSKLESEGLLLDQASYFDNIEKCISNKINNDKMLNVKKVDETKNHAHQKSRRIF